MEGPHCLPGAGACTLTACSVQWCRSAGREGGGSAALIPPCSPPDLASPWPLNLIPQECKL